ncbi:MAG: FAD/NAD(P)-binding protein [Bacteroidota bacterium]
MHVGIIGNGFSGLMTCYHLVAQSSEKLHITIFEKEHNPGRGIAYSPQSEKVLLNVIAGKMSAFSDQPDDFVNWLSNHHDFNNDHEQLISSSFVPRARYGEYLAHIWLKTKELARLKNIELQCIQEEVIDLNYEKESVLLSTKQQHYKVDKIILATGNQLPRNPILENTKWLTSSRYSQNPWNYNLKNIDPSKSIFILGNGLTMVDTVIQIREQKLENQIISLSPHGFNILPHRNFSISQEDWLNKLGEKPSLQALISEINKQLKTLKKHGISAEPLIDYLRPHTQKIWRNFTLTEKKTFLVKFRHLWGVARHRLPFVTYDIIQKERIQKSLTIISGKLISVSDLNDSLEIIYFDKALGKEQKIEATFMINCTGPESDFTKSNSTLLKNCIAKGILTQDELKLGIRTDITSFQTINSDNEINSSIYTLGSTLRGELWESTAINELRSQAKMLAEKLLPEIK